MSDGPAALLFIDRHAPLSSLAPTERFSDRACDYALYRPSYPSAAIDLALQGLGPLGTVEAADIGAGTGISARLLADRGVSVVAVEPNEAMRLGADPHPLVSWKEGTAEGTGLSDSSVDLVVCAQSFHWFRPLEALAEFRRILRHDGRLVLLAHERDDTDAVTRDYNAAIRRACDREMSEGMRALNDAALAEAGCLTSPVSIPCEQRLTREGLLGRARSASYVPKEGPRYEAMVRELDSLFERGSFGAGFVTLRYRTHVWVTPRRRLPEERRSPPDGEVA